MDVAEARALLDVERGASAEQLRRAYMRAIKRASPERDPEGFARARAAYELLQSAGSPSAMWTAPVPRPREHHSAPGDAGTQDDEPAQAARVAAFARAEQQRGEKRILVELEDGVSSAIAERDGERTSLALGHLLDEIERRATPDAVEPDAIVRAVLELHRMGRPELAAPLFQRWYSALYVGGLATSVTGNQQVRLLGTAELCRCFDDVSAPIRELIARGLLDMDPSAVEPELIEHARHRPFTTRRAYDCFLANAPNLAQQYGEILRAADPELRGVRSRREALFKDRWTWLWGPLLMAAVLAISRRCDESSPRKDMLDELERRAP